ncbi:MAG: hypothetical protein IKT14_06075 [Clostridiales bacterium]|nr:hypothetical protein [Clostridiales bacterium]MBR6484569.1 hypothetical protein [Clostridiales bacterium]
MPTSVSLQHPFSYSLLLTILLIAAVLLPAVILIIMRLKGVKLPEFKKKQKVKKVKYVPKDPASIKARYLRMIDDIQNDRAYERIDNRESYLRLSTTVRNFVNELTGSNTQNLTLSEIETLQMPSLYELIKDFYRPEFAYDSGTVDMMKAFGDARTVIREWN